MKHLIWRVKLEVIATRQNLFTKHIARDKLCPICKQHDETTEHIFLLCPWTTPVWHSLQICKVPTIHNVHSFAEWLQEILEAEYTNSTHKSTTILIIFYAIWFIWKARNTMVFEDKHPNPTQIFIQIRHATRELLSIQLPTSQTKVTQNGTSKQQSRNTVKRWSPPNQNFIKLNTDASLNILSGAGYSGLVFRDHLGSMQTGGASPLYASSPFLAEALALREGVSLAAAMNFKHLVVESDCQTLMQATKGKVRRKEIEQILKDIQAISENFTSIEFKWIPREANTVADLIANLARHHQLPRNWIVNPPPVLASLINSEKVEA